MDDIPARVAVLEQIARDTKDLLGRMDGRLDRIEDRQVADFRWMLGAMIGVFGTMIAGFTGLLGVVAHGFHWL